MSMNLIGGGFKHLLGLFLLITFSAIGGGAMFYPERGVVLTIMGVILEVGGAIYLSDKLSGAITKWLKKRVEG